MTLKRCPQCEAVLPEGRSADMCPACLLAQGQSSSSDSGVADAHPGLQPTMASQAYKFEAPSLEEIASVFPQLEVLNEIGRGGMGAVYRVRQKSLHRVVALKVLPRQVASDPAFAERFTREARTLAQLNHPHIVTVYEAGEIEGLYYLMMEYVDGVNLREAMRSGQLDARSSLEVVGQICDALQYAHDNGIVHRDIKPENILLDRTGRVHIADFGLAKLVTGSPNDISLTGTHQVMGTWHYMAPEQLDQPLAVDHRADIYSLGVVFYELLTGQVPAGRFKPPSAKASVDHRLDEVVMRALEREPSDRYQQASEISQAVNGLSDLVEQVAMSPTKPGTPHTVQATDAMGSNDDSLPNYLARNGDWAFNFSPGSLAMGIVMLAIGAATLVMNWDSRGAMVWIGLGLTVGGIATFASGFTRSEEPICRTPDIGHLIGGLLFGLLGVWMLIVTRFDEELFSWIGMGLSLGGGGIIAGGWSLDAARRPISRPRLDRLVSSVGFLFGGVILLLMEPIDSPQALTWIGIGLYLAGASTFASVWGSDETE